jgi:ubiquinone/menaquinone biosynthesis C-methylase UbiE
MGDALETSWNSFTDARAGEYLRTHGHPDPTSLQAVVDLLVQESRGRPLAVLDIGCGNGALIGQLRAGGVSGRHVGVDFSLPLLDAARAAVPDASVTFVRDNVETLETITGPFDVAVFSHVIEMLGSPERALLRARELAPLVIIRFFEPPEFDHDTVELREMEIGNGTVVPYLRRMMSRDYYRLILAKAGCRHVDVYRYFPKDQVHVLHFDG